ncbi:mediator of RNA polymerase II transcription subunit 15a [Trifolium repens]|nr:mediator of RNA polymerase II transcription subunit 15a [Trifolium repens]
MDSKSHITIANTMPSDEDWMDIINGIPNQDTEPKTNTSEWRSQIQPETRQRIVNFVLNILIKYAPNADKRLLELQMIAQRFEENIFTCATTQVQYSLRGL